MVYTYNLQLRQRRVQRARELRSEGEGRGVPNIYGFERRKEVSSSFGFAVGFRVLWVRNLYEISRGRQFVIEIQNQRSILIYYEQRDNRHESASQLFQKKQSRKGLTAVAASSEIDVDAEVAKVYCSHRLLYTPNFGKNPTDLR